MSKFIHRHQRELLSLTITRVLNHLQNKIIFSVKNPCVESTLYFHSSKALFLLFYNNSLWCFFFIYSIKPLQMSSCISSNSIYFIHRNKCSFEELKVTELHQKLSFLLKKKKFYLKIQCFPLHTLLEVMGIKATELQYTQILTSFSSYNRYIVPHICFSVEWCCQSYFSIFCINVELSLKVSMTINGKPAKQTSL